MGQEVYVLMSLEGSTKKQRDWRPVAVVTDPELATQWQQYGKDVDWVPLELDEVKYLAPGEKAPQFMPHKTSPIVERAIQTAKKLEETNARLLRIIDELQAKLGIKEEKQVQQRSQPATKASLLTKDV